MNDTKRFAVGASVWVANPGVKGVVTQADDERTVLGEYWHTIRTDCGPLHEPGCNMELTPTAVTNADNGNSRFGGIHFHGDNARMNLNSTDNSTNVATKNDAFFLKMRDVARTIPDDQARSEIMLRLDELQKTQGQGGFLHAYERFIGAAANHMTLFAPFLPTLAHILSGKL